MRTFGYGVVVLGAVFWVVVGSVEFSAHLKAGKDREVAGVARSIFNMSISDAAEEPWYVQALPGIGNVARTLIPGSRDTPKLENSLAFEPTVSVASPTCTIFVNPSRIPYGGRAIVTWVSHNAHTAILQDVGAVSLQGTLVLDSIDSGRAVLLSVVGEGGGAHCAAEIEVEPLVVKPPTCVISAHPETVVRGGVVKLSWGAQNAAAAALLNFGEVSLLGGTSVSPQKSGQYTLEVRSKSGWIGSCSTEVTVL